MSYSDVISSLNEAIRIEHTLAMQCEQYALTLKGLWRIPLTPYLEELAGEAREHARKFGQKVVALGGIPTADLGAVRAGGTAEDMINEILRMERSAIEAYKRSLTLVPDDDVALRTMIEDHIESEQRHIDEIALLVFEDGTRSHDRGVRRVS